MKILFIGYSKLFKNKIIPVLNQLIEIEEIHIAKFKDQEWSDEYKQLVCSKVFLYDSYEQGINSNVDIAYISSVNSDHYNSAKKTLSKHIHTIIDKPAVLSVDELISLFFMQSPNLLLAEANVYTYHPQFEKIKEILQLYNSEIRTINVLFSIPPLEFNNFRYKKELGGGVVNDMGPYAVSIGRYFYNEEPKDVIFNVEKINDIEISLDIILKYSKHQSVIGHFGFNSQYVNSMTILTDNTKIDVNRVFTVPDDSSAEIKVKYKNEEFIHSVYKSNSFYLFFKDIFNSINNGDYTKFKNSMWADCKTLEFIRHKI